MHCNWHFITDTACINNKKLILCNVMSTTLSAPLLGPRTDTWCVAYPSGNCHFAGTFFCITLIQGTLHYLCCVLFLDVLAIHQSCIILYTLCTVISPVSQTEYPRETLLTLRRLMSYIYGAPILDVSRSHTTTQHSR